ncbi:hypothetical protein EBZ80_09330 [bacterium]|nr:hypothetical protein [bacterium]
MTAQRQVSAQLFVQLYLESVAAGHTMREFSKRLGWTYARAAQRAGFYRKRGVDLPRLADGRRTLHGREPLNVAGLNEMIDRFLLSKREHQFDRRRVPVNAG